MADLKLDAYSVKAVDKACLLIDLVSNHPEGIGITELASQAGMYKSTVHRLLGTLTNRGFIEQDSGTGKYKLGYALLDFGMKLLSSIDLRHEAMTYLQELAVASNEVVHLAILDQGEIVYVEKVESQNTTRMHSRVGKRVAVHATGLGKAILAFLPLPETMTIIDAYGLPVLTEHTITDRTEFLKSLADTREKGYAVDIEENQVGISCIAAPIWDNNHRVVAACSVSGPSVRMTAQRMEELYPLVTQTGLQVSKRLGYGVTPSRF